MNHPIRRYALSLSNEPLFFSAVMGSASSIGFLIYLALSPSTERRLVWNRKSIWLFLLTGVFETLSILFIVTALSLGSVVVVVPIAATYPVWATLGTLLFLRGLERINVLTILGTLSVVTGTISIHLGH